MANPLSISNEELAYIAGFVDGEGTITIISVTPSVSIRKRMPYFRPVLSISNTNKEILDYIKNKLGVGWVSQGKKRQINRKTIYKYIVSDTSSINVCRLLFPFLKIKKQNAELLIEYGDTIGKNLGMNGVTKEMKDKRKIISDCVRSLNTRGEE